MAECCCLFLLLLSGMNILIKDLNVEINLPSIINFNCISVSSKEGTNSRLNPTTTDTYHKHRKSLMKSSSINEIKYITGWNKVSIVFAKVTLDFTRIISSVVSTLCNESCLRSGCKMHPTLSNLSLVRFSCLPEKGRVRIDQPTSRIGFVIVQIQNI